MSTIVDQNSLENMQVIKYCKRCGRRLKSAEAIERGYGKICYEKARGKNGIKALFAVSCMLDSVK